MGDWLQENWIIPLVAGSLLLIIGSIRNWTWLIHPDTPYSWLSPKAYRVWVGIGGALLLTFGLVYWWLLRQPPSS